MTYRIAIYITIGCVGASAAVVAGNLSDAWRNMGTGLV